MKEEEKMQEKEKNEMRPPNEVGDGRLQSRYECVKAINGLAIVRGGRSNWRHRIGMLVRKKSFECEICDMTNKHSFSKKKKKHRTKNTIVVRRAQAAMRVSGSIS